jgi:hypothetical protein
MAIAKAEIHQKFIKHGGAAMSLTRGLQHRTQFVDYYMSRNLEFHAALVRPADADPPSPELCCLL